MKKLLLFFLLFLTIIPVRADFISLIRADQCETIIEVFIDENQVRLTLEIGMNDLVHFKEIIPIDLLPEDLQGIDKEKMIRAFFNEQLVLKVNGKIIHGRILKQEMMPRKFRASLYTGQVDTTSNISKIVLFTEIIYSIQNKPASISLTPPIEEEYSITLANIGMVAYHKNIPINDLRYFGAEETIILDWTDPWYTKFTNRNLKRHHSSSLLSFLYVDPYEVRHEVLVRIKDLDNWMEMGYGIDDVIQAEDQPELKDKVAKFLKGRNIVSIDGVVDEPIIDKVHWVKWSLSGIQILEIQQDIDYSSAVIGVIFAYPHDSIPKEVSINWDMFTDRINNIPNVATDPVGPMPYNLTPDDNILVWKNYMKKYKLPTITEVTMTRASFNLFKGLGVVLLILALIGVIVRRFRRIQYYLAIGLLGLIVTAAGFFFHYEGVVPFIKKKNFTTPESADLINRLLLNTYRAFDFREESDIYDKLAISNEGELLTDIYLQTKKSMVLENQGGLQVKVEKVELLGVAPGDSPEEGLAYRCQWQVYGKVGHWGHIHRRTNLYDAILSIKPVNGVWKLYDIDIIEEKRL